MKKFECDGCGGSLRESGKFYVCENCGTKYVLGKDDEGNPFTYKPIEKKELSHDEMAHKASQIAVNTITVREIKLSDNIVADVHKEALSIDTQDNIQVIKTYLKAKEWDAAQRQINQLLLEDNTCAEAQWLGLMCERKVSTERELLSTFSNFSEAEKIRLDKMLGNSSPSFAKSVIDLLFEGSYANDAMCCSILSLILPYAKNEVVYSGKEYVDKIDFAFGKIIDKSYCNSFDYLIANALNSDEVDKYIQYVERFADKTPTQISKKYYAKIIEVDPGNTNVHRKLVKADILTDETTEKSIFDFENLLKHSSDSDKETYNIISIVQSYDPTTSAKADFMWDILGYHSAAPEGLKKEILDYAFILIHSALWNQARNFLNLVLSFDAQNADAYWGLCLVGLQAKSYSAVMTKNDNLIERPEFAKCLSLYQRAGNKEQSEKLMALTKKQKSAKKAKKAFLIAGIAVVAIAGIAAAIIYGPKIINNISDARESQVQEQLDENKKAYDDALALLESGEYQDAYEAFSALGDFKDSKKKMQYAQEMIEEQKNNYSDALSLYKNGKYEEAIAAFTALKGYEESSNYIKKCEEAIQEQKYSEAVTFFETGKYEEAIEIFKSLSGYKDSNNRITECEEAIQEQKYSEAINLFEAGKYEEAIEVFKSLNGYKDSNNRITECEEAIQEQKYSEAVGLFEAGKYEEAIELFKSLNGYKDSNNKISECEEAIKEQKYQNAVDLYKNKQYEQSVQIFKDISDYKDSSEYIWKVSIKCAKVGDSFYFGVYEQDNNTANGPEPIEWVILYKDNDKAFVISKYILDKIQYSTNTKWNGTSWEKSYARKWLNNDFYDAAFSNSEKNLIIPTSVKPDEIAGDMASPGNATKDRIFIPGLKEYEDYCKGKDVAKELYTAYSSHVDAHGYWIRHRRWIELGMIPRVMSGMVSFKVADEYSGVRPAMWISIPE